MITSIQNPRIQQIRELIRDSKLRKSSQLCVLEGVRLLEEAVLSGQFPQAVFYSDQMNPRGNELVARCEEKGVEILEVSADLLGRISDTEHSQGVLAIQPIPNFHPTQKLTFVVILDAIRDPGNAGTILRTAAAAGVDAIWLAPGCTDVYSPKVLRSAMGAHFHLAIQALSWQEISNIAIQEKLSLLLADSEGGKAHHAVDLSQPVGLVICNEAEGPTVEARSVVMQLIHIQMPGKFEFLNAGIAAAILIFEVVRQRNS